jgi:hypothetical protein
MKTNEVKNKEFRLTEMWGQGGLQRAEPAAGGAVGLVGVGEVAEQRQVGFLGGAAADAHHPG